MKVPKYIKQVITRLSKAEYEANRNNIILRNWLESKGVDLENSILIDCLIDNLEYGNNRPKDFISKLERYDFETDTIKEKNNND